MMQRCYLLGILIIFCQSTAINSTPNDIDVHANESATLFIGTSQDIRRIYLNGSSYPGPRCNVEASSLMFDHRNRTVCFIQQYNKTTEAKLSCAKTDDLSMFWDLPSPTFYPLLATTCVALDWISGNWYYADDDRDMIYMCTSNMKHCYILIDVNLNRPKSIVLDPTKGFMFFTKWGQLPAKVERAKLNGLDRRFLVNDRVVNPYGLTVDISSEHIYWVDTFSDIIERINYDGSNRRSILKGFPIMNFHDISVFENHIYATSRKLLSIIKINKFNSSSYESLVTNLSQPFSIRVYRELEQSEIKHPCMENNGGCDHICVTAYNNQKPSAQCLCQPGYSLNSGKCTALLFNLTSFLIYGKINPPMIKGISMNPKIQEQIVLPLNDGPTSMSYDIRKEYIYYTGKDKNSIKRIKLNGTKEEIVKMLPNMSCDGIAIDSELRNLFWIDGLSGTINVFNMKNPTIQKVLITNNTYQPRSILIDPDNGVMFWGNWPQEFSELSGNIVCALIDGSHQRIVVDTDIKWPQSLTMEYFPQRLYWSDVYYGTIERIDLDGNNREVIKRSISNPYGIAVYENVLFWIETKATEVLIKSYNLVNHFEEILGIENGPFFTLKAYNSEVRTKVSPYWCEYSELCPGLCLYSFGPVCMCGDGYALETTDDEDNNCVIYNDSIPKACAFDEFLCIKKKQCLPMTRQYVCVGDNNCDHKFDGNGSSIIGPCCKHFC